MWHLAQINIGKIIGVNINDPVMATFVAQIEEVNALAEGSKGFVWRLKDDNDNATSLNPFNDDRIIVNMSVWETVEDLIAFTYKGKHLEVLKNRHEWFSKFDKVFVVMWYVPVGHFPSVEEAIERLDYLDKNGSTPYAFDFRTKFPSPA